MPEARASLECRRVLTPPWYRPALTARRICAHVGVAAYTWFLLLAIAVLGLAVMPLQAAEIVCAGVLGNSGEQGPALVRFEGEVTSGLGCVCDRYGALWDRAGSALNRYAVDGRLLATYKLPKVQTDRGTDAMALAGDTLMLRLGKQLYALAVDAPAGSEVKTLGVEAGRMSFAAKDGGVLASRGLDLFLVNATGEKKPVATLKKQSDGLEFGPDGRPCVVLDGKVYRVLPEAADGLELLGATPGERAQFLNGNWYGSAWHSTLRRFDKDLRPAPGVVLGGNSGSFIGHVAEQSEVVNGRGMAQVRPELFAVSGFSGILHLLEWKGADKRFEPLRRLGAVQVCSALGLDRDGRTWCTSGNWNWQDGPATPQHWGVPAPEKVFGITMLDADAVCGYGFMWGKPMLMFGRMDKEIKLGRIESPTALPKEAVAVAVSELRQKRVLLVLEGEGRVTAVQINPDGSYNSEAGPVQLITATPVKDWTSLVNAGPDTLLAAGDGWVLEFARDGDNWREKRRWNSSGPEKGDTFGGAIWLALDAGRLWVSDQAKHRVLCFDVASGKPLAVFGVADTAGTDLLHLDSPTVLAARGQRAVLYDSGNQRLMKLELRAP